MSHDWLAPLRALFARGEPTPPPTPGQTFPGPGTEGWVIVGPSGLKAGDPVQLYPVVMGELEPYLPRSYAPPEQHVWTRTEQLDEANATNLRVAFTVDEDGEVTLTQEALEELLVEAGYAWEDES